MERYVFIHGSSVGQSVFIPENAPRNICSEIADRYFKGRTMRQKESEVKFVLFVDLYQANNERYCVYSFVNNECLGSDARSGQYFSLSIMCKDVYVYPEVIYQMLKSAYFQMIEQKHVIFINSERKEQYAIPQFDESLDYLSAFIKLVGDYFDNITGGAGKPLPSKIQVADYFEWRGFKVNNKCCNSMESYDKLCKCGRLYIAEEYKDNETIYLESLKKKLNTLEDENSSLKQRIKNDSSKKEASNTPAVNDLRRQLNDKDEKIRRLSDENEENRATIVSLRKELKGYQSIGKVELLKIILLFVVLLFTAIDSYMSYKVLHKGVALDTNTLTISKQTIEVECDGGNDTIKITSDKEWTFGCTSDWVVLKKTDDGLNVEIKPQTDSADRHATINVEFGKIKNQIKVHQKGKQQSPVTIKSSSFVVSPNEISVKADGETKKITITCDKEWKIPNSRPKDWITLSKKDGELSVKVNANPLTETRTATFMVTSEDVEKQITVNQHGKIVEKVDSYQITIKRAGETLSSNSEVKPGEVLTATIENASRSEQGYDWFFTNCTYGNNKSSAPNNQEVNVTIGDGDGDVVISYGSISDQAKRTSITLLLVKDAPQPEPAVGDQPNEGGQTRDAING